MSGDNPIPVLTEVLHKPAVAAVEPSADLASLQASLCAASLQLAEARLRDACREAEHVLLERVMRELRAELPVIVRDVINDYLKK
ncbi:MAG: hypothetical protein WBN23_15845 [Woeseia sp.]|jgi:hypothetical protein